VPIYCNLSMNNTCTYFLHKATKAEAQLHNLLFKGKMNKLDTRKSLFDTLAKSVLMYASHLWGLKSFERLTTFQLKFLKRTLYLPMYTPTWFVRLETNCIPIEYSLVKNCINFWLRIISKPKTSIIRQCYDTLQRNMSSTKMKCNWFKDFYDTLKRYECSRL
jgi:hypothetical protein